MQQDPFPLPKHIFLSCKQKEELAHRVYNHHSLLWPSVDAFQSVKLKPQLIFSTTSLCLDSSEYKAVKVMKSIWLKPLTSGKDWEMMTASGDLITDLDTSSFDYSDKIHFKLPWLPDCGCSAGFKNCLVFHANTEAFRCHFKERIGVAYL